MQTLEVKGATTSLHDFVLIPSHAETYHVFLKTIFFFSIKVLLEKSIAICSVTEPCHTHTTTVFHVNVLCVGIQITMVFQAKP